MDLEKIRDFRNEHNRFGRKLGIVVEELRPGWARVSKTVMEDELNPVDLPHGGIYFAMADTACGSAMAAHGWAAVTVNCSFSFLRSAKLGDHLTAEATEVKSGRTICVFDAEVKDQDGRLLATGTFTFCQTGRQLLPEDQK